jgi:hypothetical protein
MLLGVLLFVVVVVLDEVLEGRWIRWSAEPLVPARVADRRPMTGPGLGRRREER